jgi:integrase
VIEVDIVKVTAKVVTDNTGVSFTLPVLLTKHGVIEPLLDYLLNHQHDRSLSWMNRVVQSALLLARYMSANHNCFNNPTLLFQNFAQRLYSGTINDDGLDDSELYWLPRSTNASNVLIAALTGLTDWLAQTQRVDNMNPIRIADGFTEQLNYAAWFRKNQYDFLGHIKNIATPQIAKQARNIRGRRATVNVGMDATGFPERYFQNLLLNGFGGQKDRRCIVRDQLILLMLHGAGVRESEPMHLYIQDVYQDNENPELAMVRLYHPEDGRAPDNWKDRNGCSNRSAYLKAQYGLVPKNRLQGTGHAGWKSIVVDSNDKYIQLFWFPHEFGIIFNRLWAEHLYHLSMIDRHHPYAFISYHPKNIGHPYTLNAFKDSYDRALKRIGLSPSKAEGLTPHGHRHAYGRRLQKTGVEPLVIRKALHHKSIASQVVYTTPSIRDVTKALSQSTQRLDELSNKGEIIKPLTDWKSLIEHGFDDVDPDGLLSGKSPKLARRY